MNLKIFMLLLLLGTSAGMSAMDRQDTYEEVNLQELRETIKNPNKESIDVYMAFPKSDLNNEREIYYAFDIGFYKLNDEQRVITPSIKILNECFAEEMRQAQQNNKVMEFINDYKSNNPKGLGKYYHILNQNAVDVMKQVFETTQNPLYVPEYFRDLPSESKEVEVTAENQEKITAQLQTYAKQLQTFTTLGGHTHTPYSTKIPSIGLFVSAAVVASIYTLYRLSFGDNRDKATHRNGLTEDEQDEESLSAQA